MLVQTFKKMRQDKRDYRAYQKRVNELPEDYRSAMKAVEKYMWHYAKGAGMFVILKNILEMFENSADDGLSVNEVVGNDIAGFADAILAEYPEETWMNKSRNELRNSVK
ncbi:DNA-binding ferritin-like protein (Dps family) [Sinobaca qinghaiensis]|uniref:DNA-binding ferritin-like protein (Dps family) n=1 Tax=Sinobaca qinghaiensis TaxID=342944 RepID=A0A419V789_9BACL|nr:DUF1048 domain-containing protein [Sinobaca qinghaiensis]RKD75954.1 DNA-binding ferritin-like protein (Dps family) [Sinobaca qinghaiensis]